jgi:APA family basic amino acid/polyamine antiporter
VSPSKRRLGVGSAGALVVANMIGVGVFTTSGFALADLHRPGPVLLAWCVGGVLAMCGALSYGALARQIPVSGGEYTLLSRTLHPAAGFLAGWVSLLAGFTAPIAAAGLGLQAYLADSFGVATRPEIIGTTAILAAGLMHGLRLRQGVLLQNVAVGLKLAAIALFVVLGVLWMPEHAESRALTSTPVALPAFAVTLVWISFSYSGWNAAVYVAGEVRDPERNLHRSLILATAIVTVVYLALNAVFLYAAPASDLAGKAEVGAIAAEAIGGPTLRRAVSVLVALALFTSISSMVMVGPRVYAQMAEDGLFPRLFKAGADVPGAAVALQVGLAIVVLWISGLVQLLGYIGFTLGLSAAATVSGLFVLRHRLGADRVPAPGYPWIPAFFIVATLGAAAFMVSRQPVQAGLGLLTVVAGLPFYWLMRRRSRE